MSSGKHFIRGALITVSIILFNQALIQFWLYKKREDSRIINVAGRQRMLSQRLGLELYKSYNSNADIELIQELYDQWRTTHYAFINSNDSININKVSSEEIRIALEALSKNVEAIKPFLSAPSISESQLSMIYDNQATFLNSMEDVVSMMEAYSQLKLNIIIIGEIVLAILSIIVLLLEIRFIYKPIAQQQDALVESQKSRLQNQEEKLTQIAWEQSHLVRSPVASLSGLTNMFMQEAENLTEDDQRQIMRFIKIETERLNKIVSETVRLTYEEQN